MVRGKAVILQRCNSGGQRADVAVFKAEEGLSWSLQGGRWRTRPDLGVWRGRRAGAGKSPPNGFPRPPRST